MHTEQDRSAYQRDQAQLQDEKAVVEWLDKNPEIGTLNSGKFYKIINGKTVFIAKFS